jgi:hypothetical protein
MALPTTTEVLAADACFRGQPFVRIPLNADNLFTMDYSFRGEPFVSNCAIPTPIKLIGVSFNHVNNFLGVNSENCGKIVGVEPT